MDKFDMKSKNVVEENVKKIQKIFPDCVTEISENGKIKLAVDFDALKEKLTGNIALNKQERYQFTWPDKAKAKNKAMTPVSATLRPCVEESVNFDTTQNVYIEGDNLTVLKLLQETYLNKVKMIYIDPPYNTGNDFVYRDDFTLSGDEYMEISGQFDGEGNRLFQNTESNGKFHTDWLNMIYPRLMLSKDLLTRDGIIFISIDDNEVDNLRKVCDEIFGADNFIAQMVIDGTPKNDPLIISTAHEYCLVYVKDYDVAKNGEWGVVNPLYEQLLDIVKNSPSFAEAERAVSEFYKKNNLSDDNISNYNYVDGRGLYRIAPVDDPQNGGARDTRYNPFTGEPLKTPNGGWRCSVETWNEWVKNDEILFPTDNDKLCSRKIYIQADRQDLLRAYFKIQTRKDTDMLKTLFGSKVFQFPKPVDLIKTLIDCAVKKEGDIVLDFFSGSATTAHAVMQLNLERLKKGNENIKYILVQIQENIEKNLARAKSNREKQTLQNAVNFCKANGYPPYITEIGKERIRRAGKKIAEKLSEKQCLDTGFRVFKLASSNMKPVYYSTQIMQQSLLDSVIDNVKPDRTALDLLFQVMLDWGVPVSSEIEEKSVGAKNYYAVNGNEIVACFDGGLDDAIITEIAKLHPKYAAFKDKSFESDSAEINTEQIFKTYSPSTVIKII